MGRRPGVKTASGPIVAVDTVLLAEQMLGALTRLASRNPLRGPSNPASNFAFSLTREVLRSFMGYTSSLPIPEFRSIEVGLDDLCRFVMPPVVRSFGIEHRSLELGGVPGILYRPQGAAPEGVILYLHGGGYIGTSPTMYAFFTAHLSRATQCAVFVADYRLAPEFPFPAGAEDATAVLNALVERGAPPERLFVAGDSGGGGLATTVGLGFPDRETAVHPAGLLLFSPEVDLSLDDPSITENADRDILPWNIPTSSYLHGLDARSPWVSPVYADLTHFPPTMVSWGGDEMFRDSIRRFVDRLGAAGIPVQAHEAPGMFHVYQVLMPWADVSQEALRAVATFVRQRVETAPPIARESLDAA